jgi:small-conductance mechanosensitive channel
VTRNLLQVTLPPAPARLWTRKVLLPLTLLAALLYLTGFLDDFLQVRAVGGQFQNITIGSILAGIALVIIFFVIARIIWRFLERSFLPEAGAEAGLTHAIATLIGYSLIILGVIAGLVAMGVDLTTLAVIAGGLSIGLGFGLQQLVSNLVSGYILMFEKSIEPGDIIQLADTVGTVQHIGIRSIVIRTPHNKEVIIPNSYFLTEMMTNLTRTDRIVRVDIKIGVGYEVNPLEVEQALLAVAQHPRILDNPAPMVQFLDFGESSLDFALMVWTDDPAGIPRLTSELRYRIWDSFKERNIEIPYPQREVHVRSISPFLQTGAEPSKSPMDNDKDKSG